MLDQFKHNILLSYNNYVVSENHTSLKQVYNAVWIANKLKSQKP